MIVGQVRLEPFGVFCTECAKLVYEDTEPIEDDDPTFAGMYDCDMCGDTIPVRDRFPEGEDFPV